jgi:hypothetical protein
MQPNGNINDLNLDPAKLRTYQLALDWVKENGVLVTPHVYGTAMLTVRASLTELGLRADDPRAKRLQGLRRKLVGPHLCAHHVSHEKGETTLGFSADLPQPPAVFFAKSTRLRRLEYLTAAGWLPLPVQPYQADPDAGADEESGVTSRWISLAGDYEWPIVDHAGQPGRWLRLIWDGEGVKEFSDKDLTVDLTNSLTGLEGRARASVDMNNGKGIRGYGQKLVGYGGYAWIGFKAWAAWQRDWQRYEAEMDCLKAYILWRYPEFQADIQTELERIAARAWDALAHFGYTEDAAADFTTAMVAAGLSRLPSPEAIQARLRLDFEVALVQAESDIERDWLEAERLRTERAEEQTRQRTLHEVAAAEQRQAAAIADRVVTEQRAMKQAALDRARQQIEEAGPPCNRWPTTCATPSIKKCRKRSGPCRNAAACTPKPCRDCASWLSNSTCSTATATTNWNGNYWPLKN